MKQPRNQQEASKRRARGQQEASKKPAASQQQASKTPARTSKKPGRGQQEAPMGGGPHETPKPFKNSHFHEENSPFSRAFPKTDFLEKSSWGSLQPARSQQEARKRPARGQQEARKMPARGQQEASKRLARSRKRPARGQQEAPNGGTPRTPKSLQNNHFHEENSPFSRAFPKIDFLDKSSWGSLKPARSQQEARKRPARGQQEASSKPAKRQQEARKRPGRSQQEASKRPAASQQEASKKPAKGQEAASKRPARGQEEDQMGGGPHETPKPLKNSHFHEENSPFSRAF